MHSKVMGLATGSRLGPYEILGVLGSGGMGEVYRARDTRLDRTVAIKVIQQSDRDSPEQIARFEHEARTVAALNHPNITALHDIGNERGIVFAVMELLEGQTLRDLLKADEPMNQQKLLDYASQIARGLAAAHERGIIHRDIKPENVFITRDGIAKILDFGIAKYTPGAPGNEASTGPMTAPGMIVGTSGYMSPEQILGHPATEQSDVFAVGVVIYELLTGTHPFRRATLSETATAVLRDDPGAIPHVQGRSRSFAKVLERCLDKNASDRPASARDLALFFDALRAESADATAATQPVARIDTRRLRTRVLAISCGVIAFGAALMWGLVQTQVSGVALTSIDRHLTQAEWLVKNAQTGRLADLNLIARLVSSFPEMKALFATDTLTVRDFLVSYQQRNPEVPLLIAVDTGGTLVARTDQELDAGGDNAWVKVLLEKPDEPTVVDIGGRAYHAAVNTVEAGGQAFGLIVVASPVDEAFAATLRNATQNEVVILSPGKVLASTFRAEQLPWKSLEEWRSAAGSQSRHLPVSVGAQAFVGREIVLSIDPAVTAVVLSPFDELAAPFHRIQNGVLGVGLLSLVLVLAASLWIKRELAA